MTDSTSSLQEVPALLDERRRYEGWLQALEARRDSTPGHVFERVQADYRARLQGVAERLASHRHAIESERGNVQTRLSLLDAEATERRDERAELELRVHVGELAGEEAERAFGTVDEALGRLMGERAGLGARAAELQSLLGENAVPQPVQVAKPAQAAVPLQPTAGVSAPATALSTAAAVPAPPPAPPAGVAPAAAPMEPVAPPSPAPVAPVGPAFRSAPVPADTSAAPIEAPGPAAPAAPQRGHGESFDELAFLSSIVGKATESLGPSLGGLGVPARDDHNGAESLLAGVEQASLLRRDPPLAANVAGNTPIILRQAVVAEQTKTLKCSECAAMNYPTEWYCERCGAELAAL